MKLRRTEKARRTTIAPKGLVEKENYYILGDIYIRVLTVTILPSQIGEGFLSNFLHDRRFYFDFSVSSMNIDFASYMQKEINHLEEQINNSSSDTVREELITRYRGMQSTIKQMVSNKNRTVNVTINIYVRAKKREDLDNYTNEIREDMYTKMHTRVKSLPKLQIGIMQKNSPLFIGNSLNRYADYHIGTMMPSLTCAAMWPFLFETVEDKKGTFIGIDSNTGGKIIFDQFAYKNDESARLDGRTSGNMIVVGKTGTGKTTFMNLLICSHLINHRKVIWCDPENNNRFLTNKLGGNYIEIGLDNCIINIFDLQPVSTSDETKESEEMMFNTQLAIMNTIEDISIMFRTLWPKITEDELTMIDEITNRTYRKVGIDSTRSFKNLKPEDYPTFSIFSVVIDEMLDECIDGSSKNEKVINALQNLQMKMKSLVGSPNIPGHLSRYFDGTTNIDTSSLNDIGLISFGTKHLIDASEEVRNALLRIIFKYAWATCLSTDDETVFVTDEDHTYIQNEPIAALKAQFQRRARKYNTVTISGTQEVKDYNDPSILVHGRAIFNNATYRVIFPIERGSIKELSQLISLTDQEISLLESLESYNCLLEMGNRKISLRVLLTDNERDFFEK